MSDDAGPWVIESEANDHTRRLHESEICHRMDGAECREATEREQERHPHCSDCCEGASVHELLSDENITEIDQLATDGGARP